jgi:hypothetical protein
VLAETGDPRRFTTARAVVKHAGLAPREKLSGTYVGRTKLTGQGRPGLRLAAWRVVWAVLHTNTGYAARYRHLTSRETNKLTPTQAQTVIAAAVLPQLHAVTGTGTAWHPTIARHGTQRSQQTPLAPDDSPRRTTGRTGRAPRGIETHADLDAHHGQPRPSSHQPDYTLPGPTPLQPCRNRRPTRQPTRSLTKTTYTDERTLETARPS